MSGATFGRKGAGPGRDPAPRLPAFPQAERGQLGPQAPVDDDLAARRAAFLAAERARPREEARPDDDLPGPRSNGRQLVAPKSMYRAYMHWFFGGGLSAHRFYLGYPASAIIQLMLTPISYVMVMNGSPAGLVVASGATLWFVADAFLLPGLLRRANERGRGSAPASTFN